jgi:hypothetical protein
MCATEIGSLIGDIFKGKCPIEMPLINHLVLGCTHVHRTSILSKIKKWILENIFFQYAAHISCSKIISSFLDELIYSWRWHVHVTD